MSDRHICKAKRTDNGEWVEGNIIEDGVTGQVFIHARGNSVNESDKIGEEGCLTFFAFEVDPSTFCQCTGLPDKDKTPMYENDIVRARCGVRGVIKFGKYGDMKTDYGFYIEWDKTQPYWRHDICYWQNEIKVIGNVLDNPKLLEGGAGALLLGTVEDIKKGKLCKMFAYVKKIEQLPK